RHGETASYGGASTKPRSMRLHPFIQKKKKKKRTELSGENKIIRREQDGAHNTRNSKSTAQNMRHATCN
ncbi:MAG: hypothetical protein RR214_01770, partial [Synergistaceae bacterium]